jgi:hypothetical protein
MVFAPGNDDYGHNPTHDTPNAEQRHEHITGLGLTTPTLDDDGLSHDPQLAADFLGVLVTADVDRHQFADAVDYGTHIESWVGDAYGTPPDSPFSERASAVLRDNNRRHPVMGD